MGFEALQYALPVTGIEAQFIACLSGLVKKNADEYLEPEIKFLEPPAGQYTPFVNPIEAMTVLFRANGIPAKKSALLAAEEYQSLQKMLPIRERARLYNYWESSGFPEFIPVPRLMSFLKDRQLVNNGLIDFVEKAYRATLSCRIFQEVENRSQLLRLGELADVPSPMAMFESSVYPPGYDQYLADTEADDDDELSPVIQNWRESIKPVVKNLEHVLGKPVYYFYNPDDEYDGDSCHRFLALHCWCSVIPDSIFVKFLLEITGLPHVDALKAELIDPLNYIDKFEMHQFDRAIEVVSCCQFNWHQPETLHRVGIVFRTEAAQKQAAEIALQQINTRLVFLAPHGLADTAWVESVSTNAKGWGVRHNLDEPLGFLSQIDELYVIADEELPRNGFNLKVGQAIEEIMWRAHIYKVPLHYYTPTGRGLGNPEFCLEKCNVPRRVAEDDCQRREYTARLKVLQIWPDYWSTGLWNDEGSNLSYDLVYLPYRLIKRLAAWQRDFDSIVMKNRNNADSIDWTKHDEQWLEIALKAQKALGDGIEVQVCRKSGCIPIKDLADKIPQHVDKKKSKIEGNKRYIRKLFPKHSRDHVFIVGGTVRDMLLGRENQDIDLVAPFPGDYLCSLGFRLVEASSGADIYFHHHPEFGKIEVTRIDSITELEADLIRRDFTVNAIAMTLDGNLFDPLAGESDVRGKLLRTCSNRSFLDDPLRIFRAFRFECDRWKMTPETENLVRQQDWAPRFAIMPMERLTNEMLKALSGNTPERFFQRMIEFGVGREFLPEMFLMPDIPAGPLEHHPEGDLFTHSVQVLQRVSEKTTDPLARFCAFFHDIGKLATDPALYPKHHGHDDAGFELAEEFCTRLRLPVSHRKALAWVSRLHGKANKWDELRDSTKIKMAEQAIKAGIVEILPLVSAADKPGNQPIAGWNEAVRVAKMTTRELGIDQKKLEAMPIENRASYILQKRVDTLRNIDTLHR